MTGQLTLDPPAALADGQGVELAPPGSVQCSHLADGKLVRLAGQLADGALVGLRLALLSPLPDGCRDVVVDAGDVEAIDDTAVAILVAAREWSAIYGARLLLSRSAPALDRALDELDLVDQLPRLGARPGRAADLPAPRPAAD
jgi:anti-anti-sigma regulatory factor